MTRHHYDSIRTVLVLCLAVSVWSAGLVTAAMSATDAVNEGTPLSFPPEERADATATPVEASVDCNRSQVSVVAPSDYRYRITLAAVNVTPTASETLRTTSGPFEGNATVNVTATGAAFAFVTNESDGPRPIARAFADCSERDTDAPESSAHPPGVRVNCTAGVVQFTAPADVQYVASVSVVEVSPTQSSATRSTRTLTGNATMSVEPAGGLVAAFASNESLGDDATASLTRDCGPPSKDS